MMPTKFSVLALSCLLILSACDDKSQVAPIPDTKQQETNKQDNVADSLFKQAQKYAKGHGVAKDLTKAIALYQQAAEQGNADAQNNLGRLFYNAEGVPQDYKQAVALFRMAAEQGHAMAQTNLGWMYTNGHGVPQDYTQAVVWLRKAADQDTSMLSFCLV